MKDEQMKLQNFRKENPKIEQRVLKDGRVGLSLVYYLGRSCTPLYDEHGEPLRYKSGAMEGSLKYKVEHRRKKEALPYYLIQNPSTPFERRQNREIIELVQSIRHEREEEFKSGRYGFRLKSRGVNFLDYFQCYIDRYTKKDVRMLKATLRRFRDFLAATEEYNVYSQSITPEAVTKDMVRAFVEYLQGRSKGGGAKAYYSRFRKVVLHAVEHDVIEKNPCAGITVNADTSFLRKAVLSSDEIKRLVSTHYVGESKEVRRAFVFCLYTGVRYCDVKSLTYGNVDYSNKVLKFEQNKTKGHSASSGVVIPLNGELLKLIGTPPTDAGGTDALIFPLPSHNACSDALATWVRRAGINKHITWHCARHSFATNILNNGANARTVASLLGHSGIKYVEVYTRALDSLKIKAINSLPKLNI